MFRRLLVPLDGSDLAEQALPHAAAIARASESELDLVLVHTPTPFDGFDDPGWNAKELEAQGHYVQSTANELSAGAGIPVTCAVMTGDKADMICARAFDVGADLIVMTSHGRTGLSRAWLGSVADAVLRHSSVPILMLRPLQTKADLFAAPHVFTHILVPLDGSPLAAEALTPAVALAKARGASITLLRVVVEVPLLLNDAGVPFVYANPLVPSDSAATARLIDVAKSDLEDVTRALKAQGIVDVQAAVVVNTHIAPAIIKFARAHGVDMIAMSTHGRGTSRLFLGSIADKVIRASELPMLVYRPVEALVKGERERASTFRVPPPALAPG